MTELLGRFFYRKYPRERGELVIALYLAKCNDIHAHNVRAIKYRQWGMWAIVAVALFIAWCLQ
jgi:hypothetical protein